MARATPPFESVKRRMRDSSWLGQSSKSISEWSVYTAFKKKKKRKAPN